MQILDQFTAKLRTHYPDTLVSAVLYGSAAAGDYDGPFSDLNVLCVLKEIGTRELAESEVVFRWWQEHGNPWPLLFTESELPASADAFAMEFRDMQERRRILHGPDLIADLKIDLHYYRAEIEHELRSKLLRLRQQAAAVLSDPAKLLALCCDSVATFCVLGRHVLMLNGQPGCWRKREVVAALGRAGVIRAEPFAILLDYREGRAAGAKVLPLFEAYLGEVRRMVEFVDKLA
jgi:hypothetical protein